MLFTVSASEGPVEILEYKTETKKFVLELEDGERDDPMWKFEFGGLNRIDGYVNEHELVAVRDAIDGALENREDTETSLYRELEASP